MRYSTGSRVEFNNKGCTVVITNWKGQPLVVKSDTEDKFFTVRKDDRIKPTILR